MFAIRKPYKGFTLIELVIGIVTLSIVLLLMTGTLFPQAARGIDPWFQVRSSELALSFMNEILAKDYDENVTVAGGQQRCNDGSGGNCTDLSNCGGSEEGANRSLFDDVDDYNCLTLTENDITNISGGNSGLSRVIPLVSLWLTQVTNWIRIQMLLI